MSDVEIFTLEWKTESHYSLFYKSNCIGEGMAPRELVEEYVRLMNWAYFEGKSSI